MEETAFYVPFSNLYSGERNRYKDFFGRASGGKYVFCVLRLENSQRDTVYSREETISSEGFFQSKVEVCVVEEETNYGQQLNGVTLNDGIYEVEAASVRAEELVGLAESYSPDVLILLEQSKEELDETIQKEIDLWQAEGGLLITFSGNETFAESQRSAFKEAPVDFLKNILDEETTSRLLAKRNTNYQKYYTISDLLKTLRSGTVRIRCCTAA